MANYASVDEVKSAMNITDTQKDDRIEAVVRAVSSQVNQFCERVFTTDTTTSARVFVAMSPGLCEADDFHTTTGFAIATDTTGDGSYDEAWVSGDWQLEPLNGIRYGESGWPYDSLRAIDSRRFPCAGRRATVEVTAQWGWAAVPAPVREATVIQTVSVLKGPDSPLGVAGFGDFGPIRVKQALHPMAETLLSPYQLERVPVW